jgi:hypothetical protein
VNLDALGNIGDFVGGIAVVVTLAYLAVQIRQNTRHVRQSVELARATSIKGANATEPSMLAIAQDPELARIFRAGLADYSSLAGDESLRFTMVLGAMVSSIAVQITEQMMLGIHESDSIGDQVLALKRFLATPGGREWWKRNGVLYSGVIRRLVDERVLSERN